LEVHSTPSELNTHQQPSKLVVIGTLKVHQLLSSCFIIYVDSVFITPQTISDDRDIHEKMDVARISINLEEG